MICYTLKNQTPFEIDDEDYELVMAHTWWCGSDGYVVTKINRRTVFLHRLIMHTPEGMETDHINGDVKNNRKSNLRVCTKSQNQHNQRLRIGGSSRYKGVSWDKGARKWMARIMINSKMEYLGLFKTEEAAALAYNTKAIEVFGEYSNLNVIGENTNAV